MPILDIQIRMRQLGRVRMGEKGPKGEPRKLTHFRLTSASERLLKAAAADPKIGGVVRPWEGAPDEGYFELHTKTDALEIVLPPTFSMEDGSPSTPYSQFYEHWTAGGCQRRCDGVTETLSNKPCLCGPDKAERLCKITTRIQFMLPSIPDVGVWRLDSHGYYAAVETPGTLEILKRAAEGNEFIPATLRIEQRTRKVGGQTRRFIVPIVELRHSMRELASGEAGGGLLSLNAPGPRPPRPELPAGEPLPADASFDDERQPGFGAAPELPGEDSSGEGAVSHAEEEGPRSPTPPAGGPDAQEPGVRAPSPAPPANGAVEPITAAQKKKLNVLVGKLRDAGHITTEQLYRRCQVEPVPGEDGEIHWSALRDSLSRAWASGLIEALSKLEARLAEEEGSFDFAGRAAEVQAARAERERQQA